MRWEAADLLLLGYSAAVSMLIAAGSSRIPEAPLLLLAHAAHAALTLGILRALRPAGEGPRAWARAGFALASVPLAFAELGLLVHRVHPRDYEPELIALDRALFGTDPTVWMQRLHHPALTEVLQLAYASYYLLPLVLGGSLLGARRFAETRRVLAGLLAAFFLSYLGYFALPARSPYVAEEALGIPRHDFPLRGLWLAEPLHALIDRLEPVKRDAFPSGHTAVTLVVLWYAFRLDRRRTFPFLLPAGLLLVFSTVYLRYHYAADVIAGAALTPAAVLLARWIETRAGGRPSPRAAEGAPAPPGGAGRARLRGASRRGGTGCPGGRRWP